MNRWFPLLLLALAVGCDAPEELHLVLAEVTPDPLAEAASLRITFDDGDGEQVLELPVQDGAVGGDGGIRGASIRDVLVEALDGEGAVVARGARSGDLTPLEGEGRDEPLLLLQVGAFSVVEGLELQVPRAGACAVASGAATVLVVGGGDGSGGLVDLERGEVVETDVSLAGDHEACQLVPLGDELVVIAGDDGGSVEVLRRVDGGSLAAADTGRADGALASLAGGSAAWWMGGSEAGGDLTSELVTLADLSAHEGPAMDGAARSGHRLACVEDGASCVVLGNDDGATTWWRLDATTVLTAAPGATILPFEYEDPALVGAATALAPWGDDAVVVQLEHGAGATLHAMDLEGDGERVWSEDVDGDGGGTLLVVAGGIWRIGGRDAGEPRAGVSRIRRVETGWLREPLGSDLQRGRDRAAAVVLPDGRVVVLGGEADGGAPLDSIEIYQP